MIYHQHLKIERRVSVHGPAIVYEIGIPECKYGRAFIRKDGVEIEDAAELKNLVAFLASEIEYRDLVISGE